MSVTLSFMADIDPEMHRHLEHVVDGLVNATGGAVHRHELRDIVYSSYEQLAENAKVTTFLPVLTGRYALMQVRAQGILSGDIAKDHPEVLTLDQRNAGRSQAAAALIRFYAPGRFLVNSAGIEPAPEVSPLVVDELRDAGVELTDFPKRISRELVEASDHVLVFGELTSDLPDAARVPVRRWDVADPYDADRDAVIAILQQVDEAVREFLMSVDPDHELHPAVTQQLS